jgi:hypothetical protein
LPCPDIEIGSRHPVAASSPESRAPSVIHFTSGPEKIFVLTGNKPTIGFIAPRSAAG